MKGNQNQNEQFDDRTLINIARYNYNLTKTHLRPEGFDKLFVKQTLTNSERNTLMTFIAQAKKSTPISMKDMKDVILDKIGYEGTSSYGGNLNRPEIEAIYNYLQSL